MTYVNQAYYDTLSYLKIRFNFISFRSSRKAETQLKIELFQRKTQRRMSPTVNQLNGNCSKKGINNNSVMLSKKLWRAWTTFCNAYLHLIVNGRANDIQIKELKPTDGRMQIMWFKNFE